MNNQQAANNPNFFPDGANKQDQEPPVEPQTSDLWRPIPQELKLVDEGKVAERIYYLREHYPTIAPEEMHFLLNPKDIASAAEAQLAQRARGDEKWRNTFLFLPLIVTWFSLGLASYAYTQSTANSQNIGQSFFALWISGFSTISLLPINLGSLHFSFPLVIAGWHWFSFADVAFTDFFFLLMIVWRNQRIYSIENNAGKSAIMIGIWLRQELALLSQKSLVRAIGSGPDSKQPKWAVEVHTVINHLTSILGNVQDSVKQSQQGFAETIDRFSDTYQQQSHFVDGLLQNTREIEVAITQLLTMKEIYLSLDSILPRMEQQFTHMAQQEELATQALTTIATDIKHASEAIINLAQPFRVVGLAQMAQQAEEQQRKNLEMLRQMEDRLQQTVDRTTNEKKGRDIDRKLLPFHFLKNLFRPRNKR